MPNPYVVAQRKKFDALTASIEGLQTRAAQEDRDLSDDELRSIQEQSDQAKTLATQIQDLTEVETRARQVGELAVSVEDNTDRRTSNTTAKDRDPGHYRSAKDGGQHSFFGDVYRARANQDDSALRRLGEHNRALDSAGEGVGVLPPVWLASEFAEIARQGRRVASAVRNIPINSAAALTLPKQTGAATVTEQSAENAATSWTDAWDSDADVVQPKAVVGGQEVSRQLIDSSNPAIDALIYADLLGDYASKVEAKVVAAMVTAAGTAVKAYATEAAWDAAIADRTVSDDLLDLLIAVRVARKLPADGLIMSVNRYGDLLRLKDTTGRPLIPTEDNGPMNVVGVGSVAVDGRVHGAGILATDGVPATYPESLVAARLSDTILFESATLRFRYDEPKGPETVRVGVWGYVGTYVKYAGASTKRAQVTAAA